MTAIDTSTAAVTALMDGVTDGPWAQGKKTPTLVFDAMERPVLYRDVPYGAEGKVGANARFIAAARQLVPALLAERDAALAGAVKVKPLVWEKLGERAWRAPSPFFGSFRVECYGGEPWQALWSVPGFCDTFVDGDFAGPDDAKQAIDARILAAIQPAPDARQAALAAAVITALHDIDDLVANSEGVSGLHLNGDMAPWSEIMDGGAYGAWLQSVERLREAIRALTPPADLAAKIGGE